MTLRLTLICHAATRAMREARFPDDDALDEFGIQRIADASLRLPEVDRSLRSPSRAAMQTARLLGLQATSDPLLRDCDLGRWQGRKIAELQEAEPDGMMAWRTIPDAAPHGGDSIAALGQRTARWLTQRSTQTGREIAICDPMVLRSVISVAIEAAPATIWHLDIAPLDCVHLSCTSGHWRLRLGTGAS